MTALTQTKQRLVLAVLAGTRERMEAIEAGSYEQAQTIDDRWHFADINLICLLEELVQVLPEELQPGVTACLSIRDRVWSREYLDAYRVAQKPKANPYSLTTVG